VFVAPDLLRRLRSTGGVRGLAPAPLEVLARRMRAPA
jgi:hypothetical protein